MSITEEVKRLLSLEDRFDAFDLSKNSIIQGRDVDGCIHPSGIGGCNRKLWYALLMEEPMHGIPPKLRRTFEHGTAVHEWLQDKMTRIFSVCPNITLEIEKKINDTPVAQKYRIAGSIDAFFTIEDPSTGRVYKAIYEIKTINNDGWERLKEPQAKHILQTNVYAKCLDADLIIFDYYNKDSDLHKRFYVLPSPEVWNGIVASIDTIFDFMKKGQEPPRTGSSWECKSCSYYHICRPELHRSR